MGTAPRILIVDDEPLVRTVLLLLVEEAGYRATEAATADEAISLLRADRFAAVISDLEMPGEMNGLDLAWCISTSWPDARRGPDVRPCSPSAKRSPPPNPFHRQTL